MVMVCFHYLFAILKKYGTISSPPLPSYIFPVLFSLVSGGFVKCNAANLIPV